MLDRRNHSNLTSKVLGLELWDSQLGPPRVKSKAHLGVPYTSRENESKVSSTFLRDEDTMTPREIPNLQLTLNSSRSCIKLPPLTTRASIYQKDTSGLLSNKNFQSQDSSPRFSMTNQNSNRYEKVIVDTDLDFTLESSKQSKVLSSLNQTKKNKILLSYGKKHRFISVNVARRVIENFESDLRNIKYFNLTKSPIPDSHLEIQKVLDDQAKTFENLKSSVNKILANFDALLASMKSRQKLDLNLKDVIEISKQSDNSELILYCFYVQARIFMVRGDIREAIGHFKQYKNICVAHKIIRNKIYAYKNLGKCYEYLMKNKAALIYFTKFLQMAWFIGSIKYELLAYDLIGMQYYYLGIPKKAAYFHSKTMAGKVEPISSNIRKVGIRRLQLEKGASADTPNQNQIGSLNETERRKNPKDEDEISSIEEVIDLSILHVEEIKPKKKESNNQKLGIPESDRKEIRKKKNDKFVSGMCRAEIFRKQEARRLGNTRSKHPKTDEDDTIRTLQKGKKQAPINPQLLSKFKENPSDKIVINHLSRNRNLKNFALMMIQNHTFDLDLSQSLLPEVISPATLSKMKKVLEKLRANLSIVNEKIEIIYGMEREENLAQLFTAKQNQKVMKGLNLEQKVHPKNIRNDFKSE